MNMKRYWLSVAALTAFIMSAAMPAYAGAVYGTSSTNITGLGLTLSGSASYSGFSISTSSAALGASSTGGANALDAPAACLGCGYNNSFSAHGPSASPYAYGDALFAGNLLSGTASLSAIAEVSQNTASGSATATNTLLGFLSVTAPGSQFGVSFSALPYLGVDLVSGVAGAANLSFSVTLTDLFGGSVFTWVPNGVSGDVVGGTELADSFSLNQGVSLLQNPGTSGFNPVTGNFSAISDPLAAGFYQLSITMSNSAFVSAVPEPGMPALLALGLAGLVLVSRRKRV